MAGGSRRAAPVGEALRGRGPVKAGEPKRAHVRLARAISATAGGPADRGREARPHGRSTACRHGPRRAALAQGRAGRSTGAARRATGATGGPPAASDQEPLADALSTGATGGPAGAIEARRSRRFRSLSLSHRPTRFSTRSPRTLRNTASIVSGEARRRADLRALSISRGKAFPKLKSSERAAASPSKNSPISKRVNSSWKRANSTRN
jgi:hypothetical protein